MAPLVSTTSEITAINPPRTWTVHGIDGPLRATVNVTVEPLEDTARSRVTIALDFEGHGIGKLLVPLAVMARDTLAAIEVAGFTIESCERFPFSPSPPIPPDPHILGTARSPKTGPSGSRPRASVNSLRMTSVDVT